MQELILDGKRIHSLETFWDEFERHLIRGVFWGRNLDAFNDVLRGGFGTPPGGFILRWENSEWSRAMLGYPETERQLKLRLTLCHPSNLQTVTDQLRRAQARVGPTVFDWLVEIIEVHGAGGEEAKDNVTLILA
ncbi:MAG: barstar family protein [Pseudomonadota bacterium]|nr:barstar family protein [Pseudomonadota bacterium]